jgi:hypothetical protein
MNRLPRIILAKLCQKEILYCLAREVRKSEFKGWNHMGFKYLLVMLLCCVLQVGSTTGSQSFCTKSFSVRISCDRCLPLFNRLRRSDRACITRRRVVNSATVPITMDRRTLPIVPSALMTSSHQRATQWVGGRIFLGVSTFCPGLQA